MRLSPLLYGFAIPFVFFIAELIAELTLPVATMEKWHSENGGIEVAHFAISAVAFLWAAYALALYIKEKNLGMSLWFGIAALCCLYVAGEEISWGQHFFGWISGDFWMEINDQGETNLHNISSWLDQKPRLILELGVMIGGVFAPLAMKFRPSLLPAWFQAICPPMSLIPTALIVVTIKLSDKILEALDVSFYTRSSEILEIYLFYYVLVYLVVTRLRSTPVET